MTAPSQTSLLDPQALRADFPILSKVLDDRWHHRVPLVYLDNASTTQRPAQVIQAMVDTYTQHYANVHRGIHWLAEKTTDLYEEAREKVRAFINAADPEQVVFTSGTTQAINLVARSWGDANLREADEILLTEMEHHSNLVPWHQLAKRTGAIIRYIPLTDDGRLELEALDRVLTERTRLLAVTAVSNVLGTVNPLDEIIRRAHDAGAVALVDGAQGVPRQKTDVTALDVDFLAFSGHKMLGPSGVGILYGRRELLEAMPPFLGGGSMIRRVTLDGFDPGDVPAKFEAGTPPIVPAIGLGAAIDYLNAVGLDAITAHECRLTRRAHEVLEAVDGIEILGPAPEYKVRIVSFTVRGIRPDDVASLLDCDGIAIRAGYHCAMPLHDRYGVVSTARMSVYLYNTLAEIDRFGDALQKVRQHFRRK